VQLVEGRGQSDKAKARGQDPGALSESELAERKRLRKENAELKMDREILLKASFFSPRRRTAKPLPVRLRSSRPVSGHSTVPGGQGLTQRLLRLGQPAAVPSLCRRRLSGRHHPRDPAPMERPGSTDSSAGSGPGSDANVSLASWLSSTWSACIRARSGAGVASMWLRLPTYSNGLQRDRPQ
jgi:hypothetical protein